MITAFRVLRERGPLAVGSLVRDKLIQLWHRAPGGFVRIEGCRFPLKNLQESVRVPLLMNQYEQEEREAIKLFLDPGLPVIELGGSIGVVSCVINRKLNDPERHVVVEADPDIVPVLTTNRDRNGCRFEVLNRALGYGSDEVAFVKGQDSLTGGVYVQGTGKVTVKTVTLGELAQERGFSRFTLVCDIEGSEIDLVERENDLLGAAVDTIIMETHPAITGVERVDAMLNTLKNKGFEVPYDKVATMVFKNMRL